MRYNYNNNTNINSKSNIYMIKIIALILSITCFNSYAANQSDNTTLILQTYDNNNLGSKPAFEGEYINFGYWKDIKAKDDGRISLEDRNKASNNLYQILVNKMNILPGSSILEVGCGKGYGSVYIATHLSPSLITCVDISQSQIDNAKINHENIIKKFPQLQFEVGKADSIKQNSGSYDYIYSVEAAQHFPSIENFAKEALRLLKPGGKLAITSHFSSNTEGYEVAKKYLPTVASGTDRMIPIDQVRKAFQKEGFQEVVFESIGEDVFEGFDLWLSQIEDESWGRDIYKLYKDKYIDYYILVLKKPNHNN